MAMTFKTNLLPDVNNTRELGSSTVRWKINGGGEQTQLLRGDGTWASLSDLGISSAMHFKGTTTTTMSDGLTTAAVTIGGSSYTPSAGDVVLYGDNEFVWSGSAWLKLGDAGSFKTVQTAITNSTGSNDETNTATRFIYSFSQTANGDVSVKTRSIPTASSSTAGITKIGASGGAAAYSHTHSYLPLTGGTMQGWINFSSGGIQSSNNSNNGQLKFDSDFIGNNGSRYGISLISEASDGNSDEYINEVGVYNDGVFIRGTNMSCDGGPEIKINKDGIAIDDGTTNGIGSDGQVLMSNGSKAYWGTVSGGGGGTVTQITAGAGLTTTTDGTTDGGNITGSGTLNLTACSTAATKGPTANVTGNNNTTIKVPKITIDKYGRVTALTEYTYTSKNTTYTLSGLGGVGTVNASGTAPLTLSATKNGTAVSITGSVADASTSASGIVNTTTQHFAGNKGFNRISLYGIKNDGTSSQYSGYIKYYNAAETLVGEQWYDSGNDTNITTGQYYWREYSPNSTANTSTTGYYENYYLPAVDSGLSANKNYQILTTKNYPDSRYVQKSGDTMTGQLYINNTNDIDDAIAPGTAAPLVIGDKTGGHLEFDSNEILAKSDGTTMTKLWLQDGSGPVHIAGVDTDNLVSLYTDGKIQANNNVCATLASTGIDVFLNNAASGNHGIYSKGYWDGSAYHAGTGWLIRRATDNRVYTDFALTVSGGHVLSTSSSGGSVYAKNTTKGTAVALDTESSAGNHGIWSTGYWDGSAFQSDAKWIVYRGQGGNIYLNGRADSALADGSGNTITSTYVKKAGDTMTGALINSFNSNATARHFENLAFYENNSSSYTGTIKIKLPNTTSNTVMINARIIIFDYNANSGCELLVSGYMYNDKKWYNGAANPLGTFTKGVRLAHDGTNYCILLGTTSSTWNYSKIILADIYSGYTLQPSTGYSISLITSESGYTISSTLTTKLQADQVWGAVYNDYSEMRNIPEAQKENNNIKPGSCVYELGEGTMALSFERLQRGCKVISDTYGFNIGETENCKTPIAVSGRALVYINEGREIAASHIGWPVCSGPNGTVSIMTEEEEEKYSSRIIGTISEIPNYEEWGTSNIKVDNRIWIYVR